MDRILVSCNTVRIMIRNNRLIETLKIFDSAEFSVIIDCGRLSTQMLGTLLAQMCRARLEGSVKNTVVSLRSQSESVDIVVASSSELRLLDRALRLAVIIEDDFVGDLKSLRKKVAQLSEKRFVVCTFLSMTESVWKRVSELT